MDKNCYKLYNKNMPILDNKKNIAKYDSAKMLDTIELIAKQIEQVWADFENTKLPQSYQGFNKIVINGMGGSGLPTHLMQSYLFDKLKLPIINLHSYNSPAYLDDKTLFIAHSYSGNTEEVLSSVAQAEKIKAKIFAITTGGKLANLIDNKKINGFVYRPKYNICGQSRIALGYSSFALLALFNKLSLVKISRQKIKDLVIFSQEVDNNFSINTPSKDNFAKQAAENLVGKTPTIVAAEFLSANAHIFANQINENAKNFANYFLISEMNHHLLEATQHPKGNQKNLFFVFLTSKLYREENQKRIRITRDILEKQKIDYLVYELQPPSHEEQILESLAFSSYSSFYLAILNQVDPNQIPWVDYFKGQIR